MPMETMENPNFAYGFSYCIFIAMLPLYWLKEYYITSLLGRNMSISTYELSLTLNKSGSLYHYFDISIANNLY